MAYSIPYEALEEATTAREYLDNKRSLNRKKSKDDDDKLRDYLTNGNTHGTRSMGRAYNVTPTTKNNPKYEKAIKMEKLRKDYRDVMPKNLFKIEKEYENSKEKEKDIVMKTHDIVDKHLSKGNYNHLDYGRAYDATRRHLRRHANESAGIFETVQFI